MSVCAHLHLYRTWYNDHSNEPPRRAHTTGSEDSELPWRHETGPAVLPRAALPEPSAGVDSPAED